MDIISPKLSRIINELINKTENYKNIIFYCSRGGLRSFSMASFFKIVVDKNAYIIEKGYKGFRNYIINFFNNFPYKGKFLVIDGFTGSGKTTILKILKKRGLPVIDLEGLAHHRGSVFGHVGLDQNINQKKFESNLWKELYNFLNEKIIIVEGESKKIGKCTLPLKFFERMNNSPHLWIKTNDSLRIEIIKNDYLSTIKDIQNLIEPLEYLKRYIGKDNVQKVKSDILNNNFDNAILFLLKNYYDKLYTKGKLPDEKFYDKIIFNSIDEAVEKVEKIYIKLKTSEI